MSVLRGWGRRVKATAAQRLKNARRPGIIQRYFETAFPRCLHLGCGVHPLTGWLNTDLGAHAPGIIRLDATRTFPFEDDVFDFVFSEHMIEHLPYHAADGMLAECFRTLKPGGTVRISTPDLAFLLALFGRPLTGIQQQYVDWSIRTFIRHAPRTAPVFVLNNFVRDWGHQFIYDEQTLRQSLEAAGFVDVVRCGLNDSRHAALRNLENESRMPPGFLRLETMTFEGTKPGASAPRVVSMSGPQ
jgi:predicted SAM-dependent methyltransferase